MNKKLLSGSSLLILAAFFVLIIVVSNVLFKGARLDLTENNLYTLSDGSISIVEKLEEPINLYYFFSEKVTQGVPQIQSYGSRVRELLEEFVAHADGNINFQVIDPEPFSEAEDQAASFGIRGEPFKRRGEKLYFGLAGTNSIDGKELIPFFDDKREEFLEYDIAKLIYNLANPDKQQIGLISGLPLEGVPDPQTRQPAPNWMAYDLVNQTFQFESLDLGITEIPSEINLLVVVHPQNISDETLFAIDQFVLRGGKVMAFVDPLAETQQPQPGTFQIPERSSNLEKLFKAWGLELQEGKIVGDMTYALSVNAGGAGPTSHPNYLALDEKVINRDEPMTSELDLITFGAAGALKALDGATTSFVPLIQTSEKSMLYDAAKFASFMPPKPQDLILEFQATPEQYTLAAYVTGAVKSAFPDGKPGDSESSENVLTESQEDINVIVVADTDILQDNLWVRVQRVFGQRMAQPWADNGDFFVNSVDILTGNNDLISIRSRGEFSRPFERVIALQRDAELKFLETEKQLQADLEKTEEELNNLQASTDGEGNIILSPEQQATIQKFREKQIEIRKQLRDVRHSLDKDIEGLGFMLKAINIGLVPLLLTLLALGIAYVRIQRRRKD